MKCPLNNKIKLLIIITLAVLCVGIILASVLGFNQTVDNRKSYEIEVSVDQDVNDSAKLLKETVEKYFDTKGAKAVSYATQTVSDGEGFIYKFNKDTGIVESEMKDFVKNAFSSNVSVSQIEPSVSVREIRVTSELNIGWFILAIAITAVLIFVYLFFMEKFASALTSVCVSVLSVLLFVAVMGIARIPVAGFVTTAGAVAFLFGAVLSVVMLNRFNATKKIAGNEKLNNYEVAKKGMKDSFVRFSFMFIALFVVAVALIICGFIISLNITFVGLQLLVVDVVATYSAYFVTPFVWSALNK